MDPSWVIIRERMPMLRIKIHNMGMQQLTPPRDSSLRSLDELYTPRSGHTGPGSSSISRSRTQHPKPGKAGRGAVSSAGVVDQEKVLYEINRKLSAVIRRWKKYASAQSIPSTLDHILEKRWNALTSIVESSDQILRSESRVVPQTLSCHSLS